MQARCLEGGGHLNPRLRSTGATETYVNRRPSILRLEYEPGAFEALRPHVQTNVEIQLNAAAYLGYVGNLPAA